MDRDGRQGWSRKAEEAWLRVFGDPGPKGVAFPDRAERLIVEGFASTRVDDGRPSPDHDAQASGLRNRYPVV